MKRSQPIKGDSKPLLEEKSDFPAIYASPTIETLDNGSLVSGGHRDYAPSRSSSHNKEAFFTPSKQVLPPTTDSKIQQYTPQTTISRAKLTPSRHVQTPNSHVAPRSSTRESSRRQRKKEKKRIVHDFQHDEDALHVSVRKVDVATRTVFDPTPPIAVAEWHRLANALQQSKDNKISIRKRLSPSLQHLELLHRFQSFKTVPQLAFSPSCGRNADVFASPKEQPRRKKRDGRYRSIDPLQATREILPQTAPLLSNRKYRLPFRADVGFPHATQEEIQRKQDEIRLETQWEEASPRLIILTASDTLGQAVMDDGLPQAGNELNRVKEQNAKQFGLKTESRDIRPNRNSLLAPPLGATQSSSQGWRPRPFYDRPSRFVYSMAVPLDIHLDSLENGNKSSSTALLCSLALYSVGKPSNDEANTRYGKLSEEFYFPAGNWDGKIVLEVARQDDGTQDAGMIEAWKHRKHKAIFSHDPFILPNDSSIAVVLQVYRVMDSTSPQLDEGNESNENHSLERREKVEITLDEKSPTKMKRKTLRKRLSKRLKKLGKNNSSELHSSVPAVPEVESHLSEDDGDQPRQHQIFIPICFGVVPFCPNSMYPTDSKESTVESGMNHESMSWPNGAKQIMKLHPFPSGVEDEQRFLDRVAGITFEQRQKRSDLTIDKDAHEQHTSDAGNNDTSRRRVFNKKRGSVRHISSRLVGRDLGCGHVTLFTTCLGSDFTQAMLNEPETFYTEEKRKLINTLPRLLVDVSGDCAIAMNPDSVDGSKSGVLNIPSDIRKRSDLIRLPRTAIPSGYTGISEFREMQFLPPRSGKKFEVDTPSSTRSIQNLLYVYPRFLNTVQDHSRWRHSSLKGNYVVCVRLIRYLIHKDGAMRIVEAIYNPAPWSGPPILTTFCTRVTAASQEKRSDEKAVFRDEVKMRLPMILDGSYHLQFSLVEIDNASADADEGKTPSKMKTIAESTIPLSSSSRRESSSGVRVATIIPNGAHCVKLGENYELHFETRLVSSVHVADPTIATALRDFPLFDDEMNAEDSADDTKSVRSLSIVPSRSVIGTSLAADPVIDMKIPFHQLFHAGRDSSLLQNCPLLVFMHLCNLKNNRRDNIYVSTFLSGQGSESDEAKFLMENLQSLFEIFRKVKINANSVSNSTAVAYNWQAVLKEMIDNFDERVFTRSGGNEKPDEESKGEKYDTAGLILDRSQSETSNNVNKGNDESTDGKMDVTDSGASHLRTKDTIRAEIDLRINRTFSKISATGKKPTPLARIAYGATQTDRWRAEAEHYQKGGARMSHLVDDEETVFTALNAGKEGNISDVHTITTSATWGGIDDESLGLLEKQTTETSTSDFQCKEDDFARIATRFRSVAQTMISPCIAPTMSQPDHLSMNACTAFDSQRLSAYKTDYDKKKKSKTDDTELSIAAKGSDIDDDVSIDELSGKSATFRAEASCVLVPFSYGHLDTSERQSFIYETIMGLWLRAWLLSNFGNDCPIQSLWKGDHNLPIHGFHAHIDILLPLCLKSLIMRCYSLLPQSPSSRLRVILDNNHMEIFHPLVGVLASCLMGEAISGDDSDTSLNKALSSTDTVLDFLIGIATIAHSQQFAEMVAKFFETLRDAETEIPETEFKWTPESVRWVKCSRLIRIRAIERLSTIGAFVAINYPMKYSEWKSCKRRNKRGWMDQSHTEILNGSNFSTTEVERLPKSGWLANLLVNESLLVCSLSCEVFVSEAIAHMETKKQEAKGTPVTSPALLDRPGRSLTKEDLLLFQSIGLHAVTCVHELVIRRHAMDSRYQTEQCRSRIASLYVRPLLEQSTSSVRWLARMESTHKIRSLWLVCFTYILQEAPEAALRSTFRAYCLPDTNFAIHRVIRLLRLSCSTFQCLVDASKIGGNALDSTLSPWLLQESFNSICASIILIIDECTSTTIMDHPRELKMMARGTLDLLLQILTVPQSAVTHLRTVGGALQALEKFGVEVFVEVAGDNLQHWVRVIITLMNSISLSVRSIAVDFAISLLGDIYAKRGSIADIGTVFATVLPEVVAREIALNSVEGLITEFSEVEQVLWPLRRAIGDIEDTNPLDDDRIDPQLSPLLSVFCRSCQAIIDGVIVELHLRNQNLVIVGKKINYDDTGLRTFDADEESLFEAANHFTAESSPMQRLRWLNTLKQLHESKGQWVEAAETLILCAFTISDSLPHLKHVWTPSEFILWNDGKRSLWLDTIGQDQGYPDRGNSQVMEFASGFLQPQVLLGEKSKWSNSRKLAQPNVEGMCNKLVSAAQESIALYLKEKGNEELAFSRLQSLLAVVMVVVDEHSSLTLNTSYQVPAMIRKQLAIEAASLRKASASLNSDMTKVAEKLSLVTDNENKKNLKLSPRGITKPSTTIVLRNDYYVRVTLSGVKPTRFQESTSIPTYFEWDNPCICRVPEAVVAAAMKSSSVDLTEKICKEFGEPLRKALACDSTSVIFRVGKSGEKAWAGFDNEKGSESVTYLDVSMVHPDIASIDMPLGMIKQDVLECKRFLYRKTITQPGTQVKQELDLGLPATKDMTSSLVELTVARPFPCALSRQRTLLTSEFMEESA